MSTTKKGIHDYQKGDDLGGGRISVIVGRCDDFFVCTIELFAGIGVRWLTDDAYRFSDEQLSFIGAFNDRYDLLKKHFVGEDFRIEALALCLYEGLSFPKRKPGRVFGAIDSLIGDAKEKASTRTRIVYAGSAAANTLVLSSLCLWLRTFEISDELLGGVPPSRMFECAAFGSLGALASVFQKLNHVKVSHYPGFGTAAFGGGSRILLGAIFGVAALLAAEAGLLFQNLLPVPGGPLLIGLMGGISERLVPELLESFEKKKTREPEDAQEGSS